MLTLRPLRLVVQRSRKGQACADLGWELDHASWHEWHLLLVGTAQEPSLPIELKRRFEEAVAIADRPGFTVDVQVF